MPKLLRQQPGGVGQYFDAPMAVVGGRAIFLGKVVREVHASTCAHCEHQTEFPSLKRMMDYVEICRGCMRLICLNCYYDMCRGLVGCVPKEERHNRSEREAEIRARIERGGWHCY